MRTTGKPERKTGTVHSITIMIALMGVCLSALSRISAHLEGEEPA